MYNIIYYILYKYDFKFFIMISLSVECSFYFLFFDDINNKNS